MFLRQNSRRVTICWMDVLDILWQSRNLCQFVLDYLDGGSNWHRGEKGFDIKGCHNSTWFQLFGVDLLDKVLCDFEVVGRLAN